MSDPRTPRNTTRAMRKDSAESLLLLAEGMATGSPASFIGRQEAAGQREMVNSTVIPTELIGCTEGDLVALGFELGPIVEGDPLFRQATLPEGWTREGSDHAMWSHIVDPDAYHRCAIFYKAAFYDRRAHLSVETVYGYVGTCLYENRTPEVRGNWATREAVLAAIAEHRAYQAEKVAFWTDEHPEAPNAARWAAEHAEKVAICDRLEAALEAERTS